MCKYVIMEYIFLHLTPLPSGWAIDKTCKTTLTYGQNCPTLEKKIIIFYNLYARHILVHTPKIELA
jgi:hypothetical protein